MSVFDLLEPYFVERYQSGTKKVFMDWFKLSTYGDELQKPLLTGYVEKSFKVKRITDIPLELVSGFEIINIGKRVSSIEFIFSNQFQSIEQLFDTFVRCCGHTNALGDFRKEPSYYAKVYSGLRYFLFHGDGNCIVLSLLFQSLVYKYSKY